MIRNPKGVCLRVASSARMCIAAISDDPADQWRNRMPTSVFGRLRRESRTISRGRIEKEGKD